MKMILNHIIFQKGMNWDEYNKASLGNSDGKASAYSVGDLVRSLGQEDPLEEEMATHSSIHAWKIPWTEEPGGLQSMGSQRVGYDWAISLYFSKDRSII